MLKPSIIIADDNKINRLALKYLVNMVFGDSCKIIEKVNGQEASIEAEKQLYEKNVS